MSVGVDSIDEDHRRLLETINELNEAITTGMTAEIIDEIFLRLEQYVVEHFRAVAATSSRRMSLTPCDLRSSSSLMS